MEVEALYAQRFMVAIGCRKAAYTSLFFQGPVSGRIQQELRPGR